MEPENYLKKHHLLTYIQDLTSILIANNDKSSKGSQKPHPIAVIQDYFHRVHIGIHVYQREYVYVSSTPYNRACFIRMIWQCYSMGLCQSNLLMSYSEYLQLIQLVCRSNDFPSHFTNRAATLSGDVGTELHHKVSFCDFMYTFQALFYYEQFICDCEKLFNACEQGSCEHSKDDSPTVKGVVILPRLVDDPTDKDGVSFTSSSNNIVSTPLIDSTSTVSVDTLYGRLVTLCGSTPYEHFEKVCPSIRTIDQVFDSLKSNVSISFNDFLNVLCSSELTNHDIGILPSRQIFNNTVPPDFDQSINHNFV